MRWVNGYFIKFVNYWVKKRDINVSCFKLIKNVVVWIFICLVIGVIRGYDWLKYFIFIILLIRKVGVSDE